jgi:hypothetical protein
LYQYLLSKRKKNKIIIIKIKKKKKRKKTNKIKTEVSNPPGPENLSPFTQRTKVGHAKQNRL